MKKIGIYMIQNIINTKTYIGSSRDIIQRKRTHLHKLRKNKHENDYLQKSFNKYGENNFIFSIILECEENLLEAEENKLIQFHKSSNRDSGYNICPTANNKIVSLETRKKLSILAKNRTKEHRRKLSESRKGWNPSKETRKKMRDSHIGYKMTIEQKEKISKSNLGKKMSEETRKKMSISAKGKPKSEEHKEKIRNTLLGYKHTPQALKNMSEAKKNMSEETKQKIGNSRRGYRHTEESKRKMSQIRLDYYKKLKETT